MTEPKPDLELKIVEIQNGKMVVMSEGEWSLLYDFSLVHRSIDINVEQLFSGFKGPIVRFGEELEISELGYWHGGKTELTNKKLAAQDIIKRLFKTFDGSPATVRLWAGENVDKVESYWPETREQCQFWTFDEVAKEAYGDHSGTEVELVVGNNKRPNVHIGTTPEHESKLDSIRHLCGGTFTKEK